MVRCFLSVFDFGQSSNTFCGISVVFEHKFRLAGGGGKSTGPGEFNFFYISPPISLGFLKSPVKNWIATGAIGQVVKNVLYNFFRIIQTAVSVLFLRNCEGILLDHLLNLFLQLKRNR